MGLGLDGIASGLDTTAIIKQLMSIEAGPQRLLQSKKSTTDTLVTATQALNTKVAALADAAKAASASNSWNTPTGVSSHESVALSVNPLTAGSATVDFRVDNLAQTQMTLVDPATLGGTTLTLKASDGTSVTYTAASASAQDFASAINSDKTSTVRASAILGAGGTYTLQLTSKDTGNAAAFTVENVGATANVARAAKDAQITLYPGTAGEQSLTSATNTFRGLTPGVDLTVTKVEAETVSLTIGPQTSSREKLVKDYVTALNAVLSEISSKTASTTKKDSEGRDVVSGGVFSGNNAIRALQQSLQSAGMSPTGGASPFEIGLSMGTDGAFALDEAKLTAAITENPDKVLTFLENIAGGVQKAAQRASDSIDGTLTYAVKSAQSEVTNLADQITNWDTRLAQREQTLLSKFTAMELAMSKMTSTGSWLTSALASLPGSGS